METRLSAEPDLGQYQRSNGGLVTRSEHLPSQSVSCRLYVRVANLRCCKHVYRTDRGLIRSALGPWSLPFPNARHLGHPFRWKNTLSMAPSPAAKGRILRFNSKNFRRSGITVAFKNHV